VNTRTYWNRRGKQDGTSLFRSKHDWEARVPIRLAWLKGKTDHGEERENEQEKATPESMKADELSVSLRDDTYFEFRFSRNRNRKLLNSYLFRISSFVGLNERIQMVAPLARELRCGVGRQEESESRRKLPCRGEAQMKVRPLGDRVIVRRIEEEEKTKGGRNQVF
jgi:hypothetical protein